MPTFLDDLEIVDQSAIDQTAKKYVIGQWWNGEPKLKASGGIAHTGGLLIDRDKYLPDFVKAAPGWADVPPHTFENGKTIKAVTTAKPVLTVIRSRFSWFVTNGGVTTYYDRRAYQPDSGMRGRLQALCAVKGYDFPVSVTLKGKASQFFGTAVKDFTTKINEAVGHVSPGAKYPRYAFWMQIEPGPHQKAGGKGAESIITPPMLAVPGILDAKWLNDNYVGRDHLQEFQAHYHAAAEWAAAWDKGQANEPEPADETEAAHAVDEYGDDPATIAVSRGPQQTGAQALGTQATFGAGNPKKRPSNYDENL